jgi:two-component system sensor histidine kinase KdpD
MHRDLSPRRSLAGFTLVPAGLSLLTLVLTDLRRELSLPSQVLMFLVMVVTTALVGGLWPAVAAAVSGAVLLDYYFVPPLHTFAVAERGNAFALGVFVLVGAAIGVVVEHASRRTREAARASADAGILYSLADSVLRGDGMHASLLERLRETFGQTSATLLERAPGAAHPAERRRDPACWRVAASAGGKPCTSPAEGDADIPVDDDLTLVLRGRPLRAADQRIAAAFAAQAAVALRQQRLSQVADRVRPLVEADRVRSALLSAVSHELRTPLMSAKVAVDSLRDSEVGWTHAERAELMTTASESLERLDRLVSTLLDVSRRT